MGRKTFLKAGGGCAALAALRRLACEARGAAPAAAPSPPPARAAGVPLTPAEDRVRFAETWAKRFFDVLDANLDAPTREKIMKANGRARHEGSLAGQAVQPTDVDAFIAWVQSYVGQDAVRREGDVVYFHYVQNPRGLKVADGYCLCPFVERGPAGPSAAYCWCSVGYVQNMFGTCVGRSASVELLESLKRDGKGCRFRITLG